MGHDMMIPQHTRVCHVAMCMKVLVARVALSFYGDGYNMAV